MKVLLVHNRYRLPGGEDAVFSRETELLQSHGDEVATIQTENREIAGGIGTALGAIWNQASYRLIQNKIREFRPAVVHFHNTLPRISPGGYYAASGLDVPVVQTLHNFRLICPSGILFRDGNVCESCVGSRLMIPAVARRCYRNSLGATATVAAMLTIHGQLGTYRRTVDRYIALTEFSRDLFLRGNLPADRVVVKPNFTPDQGGPGDGHAGNALYVGRLVEEKGVRTLLQAWVHHDPGTQLVIVGDGPLRGEVESAAAGSQGRIRYDGPQPASRVAEMMRAAGVLVFPSLWYETFGLTIIEAFAAGTPVVASRLGTMKSLIQDGVTGVLFEPGDAADLSRAVRSVLEGHDQRARIATAGRREWAEKYSPEVNYRLLRSIYADAGAALQKGVA